jgi:D-alanyl-D-alanine carboxypeptidase (penicillin-binding protein 5/6)
VVSPAVWKGRSSVVRIGRPQPIVIAVPSGSGAKLKTEVVRRDPLVAPFQRGQAMGTLRISIDGQGPVGEVSLVALEAVEEAGILGRAWDAVRLWIK